MHRQINLAVLSLALATLTACGGGLAATNNSPAPPSQHSVDLSWDPSSSQVAGYNIYRGTRAGGPYSRLNSALQASTSFTDGGVQSGLTYFYVARSVDFNSQEGVPSNEVRAAIP